MTRLRALARPFRWLRDRFGPTPVPQGWTIEAFAAIKPGWNEPLTGEVFEAVADELGMWVPALATPVGALLFDELRDLRPVNLNWAPSWAGA